MQRWGFEQATLNFVAQFPELLGNLEHFKAAADRELAVGNMGKILHSQVAATHTWTPNNWRRIAMVLGASSALGTHLINHPEQVSRLAQDSELPSAQEMLNQMRGAIQDLNWQEALLALRIEYRRQVCAIAAFDLIDPETSLSRMPQVGNALSELADAVVGCAYELAKADVDESELCQLTIIGLGKCGGLELNYISDVDVIFIAEPVSGVDLDEAMSIATKLAKRVMAACSDLTAQGAIWELDANLRPEGKSGALVRTLKSYESYYQKWAQPWEFQALLKARIMAGNVANGEVFLDSISRQVWQVAEGENFVLETQAMRRRVVELIPEKYANREIKLGSGGLRDVEFAVQLLQLVHGRTDVMIRSPHTLTALEQLATWGYVGREDASKFVEAYKFLRTLEHHIQLYEMRRTHILPEDEKRLSALGRSMGYLIDSANELLKQWRRHSNEVSRLHEKLFYRPLLMSVAKLEIGEARLTPSATKQRLIALGFVDPERAITHIHALVSGVSRRALIQRTLLPVMLEWFANSPDPDRGLSGFRKVCDALGNTPWFLGLLRDESITAQNLAKVLSSSSYATSLLIKIPESVRFLSSEKSLKPFNSEELQSEVESILIRHQGADQVVQSLLAMRRRELFRISAADLLGQLETQEVGEALAGLTQAVLDGALTGFQREHPAAPPMIIIAMGRFGGNELTYGSDVDLMFCFRHINNQADDAQISTRIAIALQSAFAMPTDDPKLVIDTDLRPEGTQGELVRSLESFESYYQRWSLGWESQALIRANVVAGDSKLAQDFERLISEKRYPVSGLSHEAIFEIRRLKSRIEAERLPRGQDPMRNVKLGPGGLSDVEWLAQTIQMQFAHEYPNLQTSSTWQALNAANANGQISELDYETLKDAWQMAIKVRNALVLSSGKPTISIPTNATELNRIGYILGFGSRGGQAMWEEYQAKTRRARAVFMRLFYAK